MLTFKQYILESNSSISAQKRETTLVSALQAHSSNHPVIITTPKKPHENLKNWGYSVSTGPVDVGPVPALPTMMYEAPKTNDYNDKSKHISQFVHHVISTLSGTNPRDYTHETKDTRSDILKLNTRQSVGIENTVGGRPVEDALVITPSKAVALDIKVGTGPSAWNPRPVTTNLRFGEILNSKAYAEFIKNFNRIERAKSRAKKGYYNKGRLKKVMDATKEKMKDIGSRMFPFKDDPINKYGSRQTVLGSLIKTLSDDKDHAKNFVHRIMNVHEPIPQQMQRLQVIDSPKKTDVFDFDHAWRFFQDNYPNAEYEFKMERRGKRGGPDKTSSFRVIAKSPTTGKRMHIATFAVGPDSGDKLKYNVKHYLISNLIKQHGYTPLATLNHSDIATPQPKSA